MVQVGDEQTDFSIAKIAETVGKAVTDLALSRKQDDIFNDSNRQLVANIVRSVTEVPSIKVNSEETDGTVLLSASELTSIIEMALVRQNAHDVAKSLLIRRKAANARRDTPAPGNEKPLCRVIRRNGEVVAWDPNKIEIAVRSAFLSLGMDSSPAREISTALTERIARSGQEFMRIEDLQDRVQEELMRQGHYKVAESYILYRAHRAQLRIQEEEEIVKDYESTQESMIVVKRTDGSSELWDGINLRRRVEFALTGLNLCLSQDEIEHELRRAFFHEMSESDLRNTIILNAKSLIEKDGDFARFAARILLTYVYEEVLDWSITRDGVSQLAAFHRRAFRANLVRGVEIERISPRLLDYNLDRLADAINPTSDLDFDYLGIQTLYDRYLIIDKTGDSHKRIEAPQLFWMRVAMGLMIGEKEDAEAKIIDLYRL
ncbi:MAG: ATP cone domain-containing protein, partial [Verrucomicrobiales bacterium]